MRKAKLKRLPSFRNDEEAERFVSESDLTQYDLSGGDVVRFELKPKDKAVNIRMPGPLLDAVRLGAKRAGMPYQRFIRMALEHAVAPSRVYQLFRQAMEERKQIVCDYQGHKRELCAILLGYTDGKEKALAFQFGGGSASGLPAGGEWRCLWLSDVTDVQLRDGPWRSGSSHRRPQGCVALVEFDVNPASPYTRSRRIPA